MLEFRFLVAVGLVSYSVFLWNEPVKRWLAEHGAMRGGWGGLGFNLILVAAAVGALSALSYRLVELPPLRRKRTQARAVDVAQLEAAP